MLTSGLPVVYAPNINFAAGIDTYSCMGSTFTQVHIYSIGMAGKLC